MKESEEEIDKDSTEYFLKRATCKTYDLATDIKNAAKHHIDSFNFLYEEGLEKVCQHLAPLEIVQNPVVADENNNVTTKTLLLPFKKMKIWFEDLSIGFPHKTGDIGSHDARLFPKECRILGRTYSAPLLTTIARTIDDGVVERIKLSLGDIPIMVRSDHCHLSKLSPQELIDHQEDCNEFGGYFIQNGNEKLIRMIILQKRNYPIAFIRSSYCNRGANFTGFAIQMKCVREDLYSRTITLHYVNDGNIFARVLHRKQEFLIPVIVLLKALVETTDIEIYNKLVKGYSGTSQISDRVEVLLRASKKMSLYSKFECLAYLGSNFRIMLNIMNPELTDKEVGEIFIKEHICVHLKNSIDKFNIICLMIEKLYALVNEDVQPDNLDSLINQEVLLSGHLYLMILREKLEETLQGIRLKVIKDCSRASEAVKIRDKTFIKRAIESQTSIGKKIEYFLSTGNLRSQSGLDLMQQKGYTIIAEKLNNMRFLSHFRSIHRGAYFAEMKTTSVRKLLPENWGFICPVHTPDGHPCGLLNHISSSCVPLTRNSFQEGVHCDIVKVCTENGMLPLQPDLALTYPPDYYPVTVDGKVIGYCDPELADAMIKSLRFLKIKQIPGKLLPHTMEIGFIPISSINKATQYPGIYLATTGARFVRPIKNLRANEIEWVSPFEQVYLSIACAEEDIRNDTEYQELAPQNILSVLASNIPFLEYNQSPRNMYQCQMAKQTMGTSFHNYPYRFDNKAYRLYTPQIPLVKGKLYEDYAFADYPSGTNAVVAVISYTGYDMEDAMILNKSSYERGMAHGCMYKSMTFDLNENSSGGAGHSKKAKFKMLNSAFANNKTAKENLKKQVDPSLDEDGIPKIGALLKKHSPELTLFDTTKNELKTYYHKENEGGRIDQVALVSGDDAPNETKMIYKIRYSRNPVIGDKFSSRHGQKGVLSVLWPQTDMPFTESGITPDIIINPHAFPSRMTIGMLIESLAGKCGSLQGKIQESEAFRRFEDDDAVKHFGKQLIEHGFNYYGNEMMYSGIFGNLMKVEIYLGVVYYQRLRHMVSDKSQARSTGPIDVLTQQPVKGRKKQGGIRFGEMERDALIAHGIAFCLHDRLLNCSDLSEGFICLKCGGILSAFLNVSLISGDNSDLVLSTEKSVFKIRPYCRVCNTTDCAKITLPFVLRYLTNELAAMNIKLRFTLN